jgi:hypothetical protein
VKRTEAAAIGRPRKNRQRKPPVRIPLPFDRAVEGLLAVAPKKKAKRKKKPGPKAEPG